MAEVNGSVHSRALHSARPLSLGAVWIAAAVAWCGCAAAPAAAADRVDPGTQTSAPSNVDRLDGAALVQALRRGGYVVYLRHTATDFSKNDAAMQSYADCDHQRMLSATGQRDARRIGQGVRALKLPVGEVLASPMCRTMETATLAFKQATPRNDIREGASGDYPGLKGLLSTPVPQGSNRWIVGHGIPFRAVVGPPQLSEGEAVVLRPEQGHWSVVARIAPDDWARLGASKSAPPGGR